MRALLNFITDRVTTKKGMWITLSIWLAATVLLAVLAPSAKDYEATSIESLPKDAQSVIAQNKVDQYFSNNEGIPALLVFQDNENPLEISNIIPFFEKIKEENISGVDEIIPLSALPPQATTGFFSEDKTTAVIPLTFDPEMETKDIRKSLEKIQAISEDEFPFTLYVTGPAGIAVDSLNLFSRADIILIMSQ